MRVKPHILSILGFFYVLAGKQPLYAQLGFDLDIKKPAPYENRELKAEKTGDTKLKAPRRLMQNMTTHYNYFFNANTKLNEIIDRAKAAQKDDYSTLLPFYNYSLDVTAADSAMLDSVIYKSKTGIVLHDLRNDWIDNMYLLWGASYYFRQNFDSAYQMFQFINYAFAEKEKDGFYKYIGSRIDGSTGSIATKENNSMTSRMFLEPPSRNIALIWQIRTMIQQNTLLEAGSLITTLKSDSLFPKRLNGALEEVYALWFYKQGLWDSSAHHLVNALGEAKNKQEKARWEYLAAQMFERKGLYEQAKEYYSRSIGHTTDPVMDIYARLNLIRINKEGDDGFIKRNIAELLKMAKRDKYQEYRDAIYSMAAQMELEQGNFAAAQEHLLKASKYRTDDALSSNKAYLQLADLSFERKEYKQALSFYDSIRVESLNPADAERIDLRKPILTRLVAEQNIVERQDSLQRIAAMPEQERSAYIKKLVRQLRRQQGLKEEETLTAGRPVAAGPAPDLFAAPPTKGEWYFYNTSLKSNGASTFKQSWGTRPNVDNWRRFADVSSVFLPNVQDQRRGIDAFNSDADGAISSDALLNRLPLTPGALQTSNDSIKQALHVLGTMYISELEDYPSAIETYEDLRRRFSLEEPTAEVLFQLYYSYSKTGDAARAAQIKKLLLEKYPTDRYTVILATGADPQSTKPSQGATKAYEGVYDLFVEGKFIEAIAAKQRADSLYQTSSWSPQLLYIQGVYHIKQREDSLARTSLNTLIQQNAGTPMAAKAENLLEVLSRRSQIEDELSRLPDSRPGQDSVNTKLITPQRTDSIASKQKDVVTNKPVINKPLADNSVKQQPAVAKESTPYSYKPDMAYYAVVILTKVDPVFGSEAKNAFNRYNKEKFYNLPLKVSHVDLNEDIRLVLIGDFVNVQGAVEYVQKTKPIAGSQIVPWLKGDKFAFSIITEQNLDLLKTAKDIAAYQKFLDQNLPVKF